jgi:hypothetical protein
MDPILSKDAEETLGDMQATIHTGPSFMPHEFMEKLNQTFGPIDHDRGLSVPEHVGRIGPIHVTIHEGSLTIEMTQDTPELRGDDREEITEAMNYPDDCVGREYRLPGTSRAFLLDLSRIPPNVFNRIHILTTYKNTDVPFPHGNIVVLTAIGNVGNTAVSLTAKNCFVTNRFVSDLSATRNLMELDLDRCGVLETITFAQFHSLHSLKLNLFHPMGRKIAHVAFDTIPVLEEFHLDTTSRVVRRNLASTDAVPNVGSVAFEWQHSAKYTVEFGTPRILHRMQRVFLSLSGSDIAEESIFKWLGFHRVEKLFLEVDMPSEAPIFVPGHNDVAMTSLNLPLFARMCIEYAPENIRTFIAKHGVAMLRAQPIMGTHVPCHEGYQSLCALIRATDAKKILHLAFGRTAAVLLGVYPSNPRYFLQDPDRTLARALPQNPSFAAITVNVGVLSNPLGYREPAPGGLERFFLTSRADRWLEPLFMASRTTTEAFERAVTITAKSLQFPNYAWDNELQTHFLYVFYEAKTADVKRPHVCKTVCTAEDALLGIVGVPQTGMCGVTDFSLTNAFVAVLRAIPLFGRLV